MYTYPNGLQCDVSAIRAKSFEALVPLLSSILVICGLVVIWEVAFNYTSPLTAFLIAGALTCAYCVAVGVATYFLWVIWCKPVQLLDILSDLNDGDSYR